VGEWLDFLEGELLGPLCALMVVADAIGFIVWLIL